MITSGFWSGRRVLLTGHTGFKGSWLALMLSRLNAGVTGLALDPSAGPQLYHLADVGGTLNDIRADIEDGAALARAVRECDPEIIVHMAAQPLVREGYRQPVETFRTNVMGTVRLLEAARAAPRLRVVLIVTTDKCYANVESATRYLEMDRLGGDEPYSGSKACAELVTACYRESFFADRRVAIVSARAGNVIGGGDFAADRIVPDAFRALEAGAVLRVRNPGAVRPWQHVLDPLVAYLALAERAHGDPAGFGSAWNIGPGRDAERDVATLLAGFSRAWGPRSRWVVDSGSHPKETGVLRLDASRARRDLGWAPLLDFDEMIAWTADWYRAFAGGADMRAVTLEQVDRFLGQRVRVTVPGADAVPVPKIAVSA